MNIKELAFAFFCMCVCLVIYMMTLPTVPHKAPPLYYGYMMKWMNHDQ